MASPKTKTTAPRPDLPGQAQVPNHCMRLNLVVGAQAGFFRLRKREGCHCLQVQVLQWPSPYEPRCHWKTVSKFPGVSRPTVLALKRSARLVLRDQAYFRTCRHCHRTDLSGHFTPDGACHACAGARGVVF
jgi:hypothetical protein